MKDIPENVASLYNRIQKTITGRYAMWPQDALTWYEINANSNGPTLEIGTAFGGSAIVARKAKDDHGLHNTIYCVDPLDGYYGKLKPDIIIGLVPTPSMVEKNFDLMGVKNIQLVLAETPPLPDCLDGIQFAAVLIDGNHKGDGPLNDWLITKDRVLPGGCIFFHDIHKEDVIRALEVVNKERGWKMEERYLVKGAGMPSQMQVKNNERFGSYAVMRREL